MNPVGLHPPSLPNVVLIEVATQFRDGALISGPEAGLKHGSCMAHLLDVFFFFSNLATFRFSR
jgi:hypothetical protein